MGKPEWDGLAFALDDARIPETGYVISYLTN
jgi:hypothetical protein